MYKKEDSLNNKLKEFKENYEMAKNRCSDLVLEMNSLDEEIEDITTSLDEINKDVEFNEKRKEIVKKDTKSSLKRAIIVILISFLLRALISPFLKIHIYTITEYILRIVLPILSCGLVINLLPNLILRIAYNMKYNKVIGKREELSKKLDETILRRLELGYKYKDVRNAEVLSKEIYRKAEEISFSELIDLYSESSSYHPIDTKDIYHKILVDETYYNEPVENKKIIIDSLLKQYLREKIIESNFKRADLLTDDLSSEDLFLILLKRVPEDDHHKVLNNIIHALLGVSSNMQNYGIVWFQENDKRLITEPEIYFNEENKWSELKTHEDTSYEIIFKKVYSTFLDVLMKEDSYKRKRDNKK